MKTIPIITIDGFSGSGKSTLCIYLAKKLKWNLLNSGIIYRILAYTAAKKKLKILDIIKVAKNLDIKFSIYKDRLQIINKNKLFTKKNIYNEKIENLASRIATNPTIRTILLHYQNTFIKPPGLIADGRDMGTVVFPHAKIKFFLQASKIERSIRRMNQLKKIGEQINFKKTLLNINKRDKKDINRNISPLIPAKDAIIIDSTNLNINETRQKVLQYIKK